MKKVDILLSAVIFCSVAVIGWRLFFRDSNVPAKFDPMVQSVNGTWASDVPQFSGGAAPDRGNYWIYGRLNKVTESDWKSAVEQAGAFGRRVSVSAGCGDGSKPSRTYINHTVYNHGQRMASLANNVLLSIGDEVCHRVGDTIAVLSFDPSPDRPLVDYLGSIKIRDILMVVPDRVTDGFLAIMGPTKQEYLEYLGAVGRRSDQPDTVFYFESAGPSQMDLSVAPQSFSNTVILKLSEAKALVESQKAVLIDVRSPAEFGKNALPGVVNVPYTTERMPQSKALFAEKKSEFGNTKFDLAKVLSFDGTRIIIVGNGPTDVRPLLALYELSAAGKTRLAWVYEGLSSAD